MVEHFTRTKMYDFGRYEPNNPLNYVHPYKSEILEKILRHLPENIEWVVVFGSSVQDYQREDSDLDLAIIPYDSDYSLHKIVKDMNLPTKVDIQMFKSLEDLVEQAKGYFPTAVDILSEGIPVYYRDGELEVV